MDQEGKDSKPQEKLPESENTSERAPDWLVFLSQYPDRAIGFVGWYILNIGMWILFGARPGNDLGETGILIILVFPVHILVLFFLVGIKATREYAYGAFFAIALNFAISFVTGLMTNALCFVPFIFPDG